MTYRHTPAAMPPTAPADTTDDRAAQPRLAVVRCSVGEARMGAARLHRHLPPPVSGLVAFAVAPRGGMPCGWAIVGRPSSRHLQASGWVELTRSATDGTPNACSALLGAAARWARKRGSPIVTYTLAGEDGTSLRAAGWVECGATKPKASWASKGRARKARTGDVAGAKRRWVAGWCVSAWAQRHAAPVTAPAAPPDTTDDRAAHTAHATR